MEKSKALLKRNEIKESDKWKIDAIYKSIEQWNEDFEKLKKQSQEISKYVGKLNNAEILYNFIEESEEINRLAEKLYVYAHLRNDEDKTNAEFQALTGKIDTYFAELKSAMAFFVPELLKEDENFIEKAISKYNNLEKYRFYLSDIFKLKPHTLTKSEEELLAAASDCLNAPKNIFNMLSNADMKFPKVKDESGEEIELTEGKYSLFIKSKSREVRKGAFEALFNTYKSYKNTFATSFTASISTFNLNARVRKYSSALESALKPNDIPVEVYNSTIDTVNKNLHLLHRYVSLKKKLLNLDEMHIYDLYVPVIEAPKSHIEFDASVKIINEALAPLGKEYLEVFNEGVSAGWIDKYENLGKRNGAYSWGSYDTMPYILLNYNYEYNDVSTFAHEMGHSIHSYYSRKNQPYIYSSYSIFCAEVASTTNEILLISHLIKNEKDENKRFYLINSQLEQIRTTVFRQVMFAEFEKITHEALENGNPLTSEDLCKIWHGLNAKYFGEDIIVDEEIDMEWARIPHFYSDFYVYQYATGYSAANSFASMILKGEPNAKEKYLTFLKSGGSDYPIEILKKAGVDMTTSKPIQDAMDTFENLLSLLEKNISK